MASAPMITAVILDDHPAIVAGVRFWCGMADPPIELVDASDHVGRLWTEPGGSTDVVVLDLHIRMGAFTYLTKAEGQQHLVPAIHAAARNTPYTPPALSGAFSTDNAQDRPTLSTGERETLRAWFESDSKRLAASKLKLSVKTVETYIERVRIKYANVGRPARTKTALLERAIQDGLIDPAELNRG